MKVDTGNNIIYNCTIMPNSYLKGAFTMSIFRLSGVHTPHRKHTADMPPVRMGIPSQVIIPMSMHIGAPAVPTVKPGDTVRVGQIIAQDGGFVSSPVHASVSGTVKKIEEVLLSNGRTVPGVLIESDGLQTVSETVVPPDVHDYDSFVAAVRASGVVGLGGAGFPTSVKLAVGDLSRIDAVVINGAECEPYITSDTRTMIDRAELIARGIRTLETYLGVKRVIIGIENNKKSAISSMKNLEKQNPVITVKILPALYPQGGEKVLIYHTVGRMVPEGKLPIDVGVIVLNCTTLAALQNYLETGMPLVEKCITVDGSAVAEPKNVIVPIGTKMQDVFDFCGGFRCEVGKVLYGGPMMGVAVPNTDYPILKNTNAILALNTKDAMTPVPTACIRCGRCVAHCPLRLNPPVFAKASKMHDMETLEKYKVNLCMECGCCSYVCPAKRPLVQNNKLAKAALADYKKKCKEETSK